jgi:hypothetical protein
MLEKQGEKTSRRTAPDYGNLTLILKTAATHIIQIKVTAVYGPYSDACPVNVSSP